jgi:hypothetical protein
MKCSHPSCNCQDAPIDRNGRRYCSEACSATTDTAGAMTCTCAHAGCASKVKKGPGEQ